MTAQMIGHSVNDTHTAAQLALGTEFETNGNTYRYVKAAGALAAGDSVVLDTGNADEPNAVLTSSAVNQPIAGAAHVAIPINNYGWITCRGKVVGGKVAAGTAAGAQLGTSAVAGTLSTIVVSAAYAQAEVQRVLAAAAGVAVIAVDAEAAGVAELFLS